MSSIYLIQERPSNWAFMEDQDCSVEYEELLIQGYALTRAEAESFIAHDPGRYEITEVCPIEDYGTGRDIL